MYKTLWKVICTCYMLSLVTNTQLYAQTCPSLLNGQLDQLNDVCGDIARNEVCYASQSVTASFYDAFIEADVFSVPSDKVPLQNVQSLSTSTQSTGSEVAGVAILRLQANLPSTLPGQGVIMIVMGDTTLQNAVLPGASTPLDTPVQAGVSAQVVNIRSGPGTNFNVLGTVNRDTMLDIDARNSDGDWLRVVYDEQPAWIFADLVNYPQDLMALPILSENTYSPMQAFIISAGIGRPECQQAPNSILVQSPQGVEVTLNVNGLDVTISSTVLLDQPDSNTLRLNVLDGKARFFDDIIVPAGFSAEAALADSQMVIIEESPANIIDVLPIQEDLLDTYAPLETINGDWINYDFDIPDDLEDFEVFDGVDVEAFLEEFESDDDDDFEFEEYQSFGFDNDDFEFEDDSFSSNFQPTLDDNDAPPSNNNTSPPADNRDDGNDESDDNDSDESDDDSDESDDDSDD